jgi:uncharacterized protein (TIGR02722 family)
MKKIAVIVGAVVFLLLLSSCASGPKVSRVDASTQTDLSGYWNDTDVRIVCRTLIDSCLNSARIDQVRNDKKRTPTVIIGRFKNDSSEHIDTEIITINMRNAIINNGKLEFVAGGNTRDDIRAERQDQQSNASEATASSLANETGADFMRTGSVKTIVDRAGNQTARTYLVTAELTDIETNRIVWSDQNSEIKKVIVRPKNKL